MRRRRSLYALLLVAAVYVGVGLVFGELAKSSGTEATRVLWRRLAWVVSAVAFAAHIGYEELRLGSSTRSTAIHASLAAALGAFGLAVAANVHESLTASAHRRLLTLSLVAWPVLTAIPAFLVAMVAAVALDRWSRRARERQARSPDRGGASSGHGPSLRG